MFILSDSQLSALKAAYESSTSAHPVADFYRLLADFGEASGEVDPASILWLRGAAEVNEGVGSQSDFIRGYNKDQYEARTGLTLTDAEMDAVSNAVGAEVYMTIVGDPSQPGIRTIPDVSYLAQNDATPAAQLLFPGNMGGWAGNHLFLALGYSDAFYSNVIEPGSSTYDAIAMMKFTAENFGSGNWGDAVDQIINYPSGVATTVAATNAMDAFLVNAYGANSLVTGAQIAFGVNTILGRVTDADTLNGTGGADLIHGGGGNLQFTVATAEI